MNSLNNALADGLTDVIKRSYPYTSMIATNNEKSSLRTKWKNGDEDIYKLLVQSNLVKSYRREKKEEWVSGNPCDPVYEYVDDVIFLLK